MKYSCSRARRSISRGSSPTSAHENAFRARRPRFTRGQIELFDENARSLRDVKLPRCCTWQQRRRDGLPRVRVARWSLGTRLYGSTPSWLGFARGVWACLRDGHDTESPGVGVRRPDAGERPRYGADGLERRPTWRRCLRYADGYARRLFEAERAVLINGRAIRSLACDHGSLVIDCGDIPSRSATTWSCSGARVTGVTARSWRACDTITHEIICAVGQRVRASRGTADGSQPR